MPSESYPGQCKAELKPLGKNYPLRCPEPALPGEDYCPLHAGTAKRLKERHDAWFHLPEKLVKLLKEKVEE